MAERIRMSVHSSGDKELSDPRFASCGFEKCLQCGRCTASCPAAYAFDDYLPRTVMRKLSVGSVETLKDCIWRCGQCYSCRARCPRNNSVGLAVLALREHFGRRGAVPDSIRQVSRLLYANLYSRGETFLPGMMTDQLLREFGPGTYGRCSGNPEKRVRLGYEKEDARACGIPEDSMQEIRYILKATGCGDLHEQK